MDFSQNWITIYVLFVIVIQHHLILAMHTRCRKGLIAYQKSNGVTTIAKHVEFDHFDLLKKLLKVGTKFAPKFPLNCEPSKKRAHVSPIVIFGFFYSTSKF